MPQWGDEWGELWGDAIATIETHEEDANNRYTSKFKDATILKGLTSVFSRRHQAMENVLRGMAPDMLYRLDTSYGTQLDTLGERLFLPRLGFDDASYRVYLAAQAQILLPERRTMPGLLRLVRALLNDNVRNIDYEEAYPKGFKLSAEFTIEEVAIFLRFVKHARPATYNGAFIVTPTGAFGYGDVTGTVAPTTGAFGDASSTIVVGGPYGFLVPA